MTASDLPALLSAALIGTERAPLPTPGPDATGQAAARVIRDDPAGTLLARAALLTLAATAGQQPDPPAPAPTPAPADPRPEAPARAARHLPHLGGTLLHEWLTLCHAHGYRVPALHLSRLLSLATQDRSLRVPLARVLGERGRWLAHHAGNAALAHADTPDEATWNALSEADRDTLHRVLRSLNPDAARHLLRTHFDTERAASRKRLLSAVLDTLHGDDHILEPLLDDTLDDRSPDVQTLARQILQRLPHSALNARLAAALHDPGTPPSPRDGLSGGLQARLSHVLRHAHPDALLRATPGGPPALITLARDHHLLDDLIAGTLTHRHQPLAQALLAHAPTPALRALSDPARTLQSGLHDRDPDLILAALAHHPTPWTPGDSHAILTLLQDTLRHVDHPYQWPQRWRTLHDHTHHLHPDTTLPPPLPPDAPHHAQSVWHDLTSTLDTRRQIWHDFKEHP
ncbi:hypothetical protein GCM10008956_14490 [Deinococcus arenae]|uniref:Uncharacterized protein n=1 Tax=Deinococcus arenae TaxID=1452751 RepID=A0A8H9L5K8_9DEIO|nr:DUF5691 domain-containing protein [Deinococcus arenae]AWT36442.1 hypothetical protein DM785_13395 [Deinococcus actinosclerus]GGM39123.1 hypothetical protein GCM10008956_14490 [Deinococcus arenae]